MEHEIVGHIPTRLEPRDHPSPTEYEMAYEARVAMDRIRFAIKHTEQLGRESDQLRELAMQLLDALDLLEALDRDFQIRSRIASLPENGNETKMQV